MSAPSLHSRQGYPIYPTPQHIPDGLKHCPRCNGLKVPLAFYRDKKMPDGRFHICKHCARKAGRQNYKLNSYMNSVAKRLAP